MNIRTFWLNKIEYLWRERPILWLSGVRRAGKTVLAQSLPDVVYFDCESARTRHLFEDVESALQNLQGKRLVIDEIHKLPNPSELLKIAHDHFPGTQVLATGSSTLGVSKRFSDTLTGRKYELWLTPMNYQDLIDFRETNIQRRLLHGGLPPFFLADRIPDKAFEEWLDSFWSRDIQEHFRLERRSAFLKLMELLFVQSGSIFEASRFATPCEITRQTVTNYLAVLEHTHMVHVIRPFSNRSTSEIIAAPKVYAFDSGFVCYFNGWTELHRQEMGKLWEHLVLNELHCFFPPTEIHYWRTKQGQEIDFVIKQRGKPPDTVECKWRLNDFDVGNLKRFRETYPDGRNFVIASDVDRISHRHMQGQDVTFLGLKHVNHLLDN